MKTIEAVILLFVLFLFAASCGTTDSGEDDDGGDPNGQPETYSLSTSVSPEGSGTVSPASGTFEEGTEVSVEATPEDGWLFDGWTGDIDSADNPLAFSINSNTSLTANFVQESTESEYVVELAAANSGDNIDLVLGQQPDASTVDAPPAPPEGAFHAWLERDGEEYFTDIQPSTETEVTWRLNLQPGSETDVQLSWVVDVTQADGSLTISYPDGSNLVNMLNETSLTVETNDTDHVLIEYTMN
jgi:hypothetical protein